MDDLERLVGRGDVDGLLRAVDEGVGAAAWAELLRLRDACRFALDTGRQLWPAAAYAEYRLALDAPGAWAAKVLVEGAGQFAIGPLSEVAASSHTWAELAPHVATGPIRSFVAHERVLRGEDLTRDATVDHDVLGLPLRLTPWEPVYPLAAYRPEGVEAPPPDRPAFTSLALPAPGDPVADVESTEALRELAATWTASSNGRVDIAAVRGDHLAAIAALGVPEVRVAEVPPGQAFAWMAWAGGSGGAHGRRRGGAAGRFGAWWAATALVDALDGWPIAPDELGEMVAELRWFVWDAHEPALGWQLRLAVWDPVGDVAWAVAADDAA
jgi:hypothetical protein